MGLVGRRAALLLGSAAFILSAGAMEARAQDTTEATEEQETVDQAVVNEDDKTGRVTTLQRIVVGAGVEKVAIDTPQAVTVVTQEDIDTIQPSVITDVVENVPGVNATGGPGPFGQAFNIRGIGAAESGGEEGRVIVNVDGVNKFFEQYRMGGFFTDPELYKEVEVLRGPASSTLYGSGALGGVINFTTKDASDFLGDEFNTVLRLKGGYETNAESYLGSAALAHRFNENAEFLLIGDYRVNGNYTTGDGTEIIGTNADQPNGLAKGTFYFGENLEQELRISYQQYEAQADDPLYDQVVGSVFFPQLDERTVTDKTAIIAYSNEASDNRWLDLNVQVSYSDTFNEQVCDTTRPECNPPPIFDPFFDASYGYETYQFSIDNTIEHVGENYENYLTIGNQTYYQERSVESAAALGFHPSGTDTQTGFFVQNELIWQENLTIIAGARVDYQELSPDVTTFTPAGTPDQTNTGFSPKIAALYRFNETVAVFGSIARTERLPTIDEVYDGSFAGLQLDLVPEKSNSYEAGLAVSLYDTLSAGDALQVKTTGFYNDITDFIEDFGQQLFVPPQFRVPRYQNVGSVDIYGVEVELSYVSDYFYSNAGFAFTRGFNRSEGGFINTVPPADFFIVVGKTMPEYGLDFGWRSRFVAAQNDTDTRAPSASFDVHDVYINWIPVDGPMVGWEARFRVDNIFDEQYQEYLQGYPAEGRTFKFDLVKEFGWS
ncbi:MAG: TonB-dependent receptor [Pseudomonadota bacterium]